MQHNPGIVAMQHQPGFTDASVQFLLESMAWTPAGAHLGATGRSGKACRAQVRSYETGGRGETIRSPVPRLTRGSGSPRCRSRATPLRTDAAGPAPAATRSEEHTYELQSLMRTSYAVYCL